MDGTNSRPACGSYTETKTVYVFWPCSLLVVRCPLYRRYIINGPRIYFAAFLSLTEKNQVWTTRKGFLPSVSILHTSTPSRRLNDKVNDPAHLTSWYLHEMDGDDGWYLKFNDS